MENLKKTIEKKARDLAGTWIECKFCKEEARIILEDRRWKVDCIICGSHYYLKTQHN